MDINKNSYTLGFAAIMVIVVAALLSVASTELKPYQDRNIELEKKQNILSSIGIVVDREQATAIYTENITKELLININGEELEGDAFSLDLAKEIKKDAKEQKLPLFISEKGGAKQYIIPLRGKGLWGPIWGFIALEEDLSTVFGAVFDHKGETPGLGAEINQEKFQQPFKRKSIFEGDKFTSIAVIKGGVPEGDMHGVDGISGGTITSNGVSEMLNERLEKYLPYFDRIRPEVEVDSILSQMDSTKVENEIILD